jgi:hypothetical protein
MSPLLTIVISVLCIIPSLGYNYKVYKAKQLTRLEFAMVNFVAFLGVFTIYLANVTLN